MKPRGCPEIHKHCRVPHAKYPSAIYNGLVNMRRLVAISFMLVLLFVLVCPFVPTPIAVVSGKTISHQLHAVIPALMFLVIVAVPILSVVSQLPDRAEPPVSIPVLDLTCARLC